MARPAPTARFRGTARWLAPLIALIAVCIAAVWAWSLPIGLVEQPALYRNAQPLQEIYGDRTIVQTFIADGDNLCQVSVTMATWGRTLPGDVLFSLTDARSGAELARARVPAGELINLTSHTYAFPCVRDTRGRGLAFTLSYPTGRKGQGLSVMASSDDLYPYGTVTAAGTRATGDALFSLGYGATIGDVIRLRLHAMTHRQPDWAQTGLFAALAGVAAISAAGMIALSYLVARPARWE